MDRILFIIPPHVKFDDFVNPSFNARVEERAHVRLGSVLTDMPLGPMALSAFVKKHIDVDIRLLDFNVLLNKVQSFDYTCFACRILHGQLGTAAGASGKANCAALAARAARLCHDPGADSACLWDRRLGVPGNRRRALGFHQRHRGALPGAGGLS